LEDEEPNIADICAGCLRPLVKKLPRDMWRSLASGSRVTVADITERLTRHDAPTPDYGERYEKQITALYASLVP